MADCIHSAIAPNMNRCIKCGAWLGSTPENTRAASGGDVAVKGDRSFTPNLEEPASLEKRAHDLFWALMQAPYADTTIGNIVCAETTPQRLESAWIPLLTAALANQQGVDTYSADYVLPCDVRVHPATTVTKGCTLRTLMQAITLREGACALCGLPKHGNGESCPDPASFSLIEALTQPAGDVGREPVSKSVARRLAVQRGEGDVGREG